MTPSPHDRVTVFAGLGGVLLVVLSVCVVFGPLGDRGLRAPDAAEATYLIPINRAAAAELQLLPGIGPALAERILQERSTRPFTDADDLMRARGIGPVLARRIGPHVNFSTAIDLELADQSRSWPGPGM